MDIGICNLHNHLWSEHQPQLRPQDSIGQSIVQQGVRRQMHCSRNHRTNRFRISYGSQQRPDTVCCDDL